MIKKLLLLIVFSSPLPANAVSFVVVNKEDAIWVVYQDDTLDPLEVISELKTFLEYEGEPSLTDKKMNGGYVLIELLGVFSWREQGLVEAFLNKTFKYGGTWDAPPRIPDVDDEAVIAERIRTNERVLGSRRH